MIAPYRSSISIPRPTPLGGDSWLISNLNSVTILFGKNGSGKSLLLRSLRDQAVDSIHYVIPERTGTLDMQPALLHEELSSTKRSEYSKRNYSADYRQHVITRIPAYFTTRGGTRKGIEYGDMGDPSDLEGLISQLIPDFLIELNSKENPPYKLTRVSDETSVSGIDQLSSGEAQLLTIGLDVLTVSAIWEIEQKAERIMLIDEPDAHIHPDLQVRFADFLIQVAEKYSLQIIIATHSTTLMAAVGQFAGEAASVVYLNRANHAFEAKPFDGVTKEMSACLGGHALMGPLFGVPILLVEGDDDYRIWSQVPRHHVASFSVIPSQGEEIKHYQKSLQQIFSALRDPALGVAGYALIDADKGKPTPSADNPQDQIQYIQLSCHESENLYLADEVLTAMGTNWIDAAQLIVAQADTFGAKAGLLRTATTWDRKIHDVKPVVKELEQILDTKRIHWTIRTAQVIGRKRPSGQLADFLGEEVLNALWGVLTIEPEQEDGVTTENETNV